MICDILVVFFLLNYYIYILNFIQTALTVLYLAYITAEAKKFEFELDRQNKGGGPHSFCNYMACALPTA